MSAAMTSWRSGGNAYLALVVNRSTVELSQITTYQDQKAMKKPNQEKKNTRPYRQIGFSRGIERAFLLIGLTSGSVQSSDTLNMFKPGDLVATKSPLTWEMNSKRAATDRSVLFVRNEGVCSSRHGK